jgi:small subunit ribosomal protein S20
VELIPVANTPQAKKRVRQAEKGRRRNASHRSMVRTYIKRILTAVEAGDAPKAAEAYKAAVPVIDKSVHHGIMHKNKASRHKSRLNARVKAMTSA